MHNSLLLDTAAPADLRGNSDTLEEAIIARIKEVDKELFHDSFKL